MKNIALVLSFTILTMACGSIAGDTSPKPVTVAELDALKKDKPDEFKSKYAGKKIVLVGEKTGFWSDDPELYKSSGYYGLTLRGKEGAPVECLVKLAEAEKFKGVKDGDVLTVTGNLKVNEYSMEIEDCTKFTAPK
jgi:hypothetical protein